MGGVTVQCNQSERVQQTVNTCSSNARVRNRDFREGRISTHLYPTIPTMSKQMSGGGSGSNVAVADGLMGPRRNSWFRPGEFHTGWNAPSGRTTPEYWDGQWEGGGLAPAPSRHTPMCGTRPLPIVRSAQAKNARNVKKKERQDHIGRQVMGAGEGPVVVSDTAEKRQNRTDAWKLLSILSEKKVENGSNPESAFSTEAANCAKLGSAFLKAAGNGERYATKKYLRAELMKTRKETGNPEYAGHLAEYASYYAAYQQEWQRRHPWLGDLRSGGE